MKQIKYLFLLVFLCLCVKGRAQIAYFPTVDDLDYIKKNLTQKECLERYDSLMFAARAARKSYLYSVMDKKILPADGNKHDYYSLSIYYWPNPDSKNGLPYIGRDGIPNPEYKQYDLLSLGRFKNNLQNLTIGWYLTKDTVYSNKAIKMLRTWFLNSSTAMNPNFNYAQIVPGVNNNLGNVYGVIEMYHFNTVMQSIELLKKYGGISDNDYNSLKNWFRRMLDWCLYSKKGKQAFSLKNNIGTAYDVTVSRIAYFIGNTMVADTIISRFDTNRIDVQIKSDGSQPGELTRTNSFGYSIANLNYLLAMQMLLKEYHKNLIGFNRIDKALRWLDYNYQHRSTYKYKQIEGWKNTPASLADLYWIASKCGKTKFYTKLYKKYKNLSNTTK